MEALYYCRSVDKRSIPLLYVGPAQAAVYVFFVVAKTI